jgi:hypothetical protein
VPRYVVLYPAQNIFASKVEIPHPGNYVRNNAQGLNYGIDKDLDNTWQFYIVCKINFNKLSARSIIHILHD